MPYSFRILLKIWVTQFYKLNAGFFLFFFILFFGIVHPPELIPYHVSLIRGMIHAWQFMLVILAVWFLYSTKCVGFCLRSLEKPENSFLHSFQVFSNTKQFILYVICHFLLYLPVLIYSAFVTVFAFKEYVTTTAVLVIIFQVAVLLGGAFIILNRINTVHHKKIYFFSWQNQEKFSTSYFFYLPAYTFYKKKLVFLVIKIAGLFILNTILLVNKDEFSMREFILSYMILFLLHAPLVYYYVQLSEKELGFLRNLPVRLQKKFIVFALNYSIILLPELLFMLINSSGTISVYAIFMFYGLGVLQLLLFTSALYAANLKIKEYLKLVFIIYFLTSILLLSQQFLLLLFVESTVAFLLFNSSYYKFEAEV